MLMELNRSRAIWSPHTGGMELGAMSAMFFGFREREEILTVFEAITGLRMNHAYIRPGPGGRSARRRRGQGPPAAQVGPGRLAELEDLLRENAIWKARNRGIGYLDLTGCMALGITGPVLRSTGLRTICARPNPAVTRITTSRRSPARTATATTGTSSGRGEMNQSLRIVRQCLERLEPGPVMIEDKKLAWPADLQLGPDGLGNSPGTSPRSWARRWRPDPPLQDRHRGVSGYRPASVVWRVESPRGELGVHMVSDGGTWPTGCTTATRRSPICKRWRPCARAGWWPMSSRRSRRSIRSWEVSTMTSIDLTLGRGPTSRDRRSVAR